MNRRIVLLSLLSGIGTMSSADAAQWVPMDEIHAQGLAPGKTGVNFGKSVAADVHFGPNTVRALYVGAPYDDVSVTTVNGTTTYVGAGAVYIYTPHDGHWQFSSRITAIGVQSQAHFGASVAVQNGIIAVGEPDFDYMGHTNAGRVWFFGDSYFNDLVHSEPLITAFGARNVSFDQAHLGASVAVSGAGDVQGGGGTWLAAGAPGLAGLGCVYVSRLSDQPFTSGSYSEIGSTCGANSGDAFGASVALRSLGSSQFDLAVGAPGMMQNGQAAAGGASVYVLGNGGVLTDVGDMAPQNPMLIDSFGTSIAIDSGHVYVGATGRDNPGVGRTGSVSLFTPAFIIGYNFDTEVFPSIGASAGDLCGASLSLDLANNGGFIVGCPGSDGSVTNEGAARVFRQYYVFNTLVWLDDLLSWGSIPHGADDLGRGVALVGNYAYLGAPLADDAVGANNGAVEAFVVDSIFKNGFGG